jgi:nucleotide-binding universal stress UspA family protein
VTTHVEHQDRRIVAGIDGSASSLAALGWAADYAARSGARLEIVTAWDWPSSLGWVAPIPGDYDPAADSQRVARDAEAKVHEHHPALATSAITVQGHPAPVLVEASRGAELLVVGSRGHGEFAGMLLGSVSQHCAAHAHCPVVVYRTDTEA